MAIYIDHKIDDRQSAALKTLLIWHKFHPLVAVASYDEDKGGTVSLYQDDYSTLNTDIAPRAGIQVTSLEWHPTKKILFVGWESGEVCVWNSHDKELYNIQSKHNQVLCVIRCSENGTRLVTGDVSGTCIGWKIDSKGMLIAVFVHDLKESITDIVFRNFCQAEKDEEISRLARAAVSGDEKALNLFSGWTPSNSSADSSKVRVSLAPKESHNFFIGCLSGIVFYVNENGSCEDVLQMETAIRWLLHYRERDMLIVVTESLVLAQYHVNEDGALTEYSKIKMSGRNAEVTVIWAGEATLAVCAGEKIVRLWNVDNGNNNALSLDDGNFSETSEVITCISYQPCKSILSAGTSHGQVISWRPSAVCSDRVDDEVWHMEQVMNVQGSIRGLEWSKNIKVLGVITATDSYIVSEQDMCYAFKDQVVAVQLSARQLALVFQKVESPVNLLTEVQIKAVFVSTNHVAISTGKKLMFYEVNYNEKKTRFIGAFNSESQIIALHEQSAYILDNSKIEVRTFQGTVKQNLKFTEEEGLPVAMDLCGEYLVAATTAGFVKMWDITRREARLHAGPKSFGGMLNEDGLISSVKCNHKGNKVSMTLKRKTRIDDLSDSVLYVWDMETDSICQFDFSSGKFEECKNVSNSASALNSPSHHHTPADIAQLVSGRYPAHHYWVAEDPRLLVCEAKLLPLHINKFKWQNNFMIHKQNSLSHTFNLEQKLDSLVVSLYVTQEQGLLIQDYFFLEFQQTHLLGVEVPYYYILQKIQPTEATVTNQNFSHIPLNGDAKIRPTQFPVVKRTMRDFVGMEDCDKATKEALMIFSYYLTLGNMDEAFKAIKVIKNESVWINMARMCVKTKRLDVASVCLGKMGHARGAMALQEVSDEPELDSRVAVLAVHLGMLDDAEHLLKSCSRFDLLNKLYQDTGQWGRALEIAELYDRIHLRNTYYNYARHLESKGDISAAIPMYEKSETYHFEVPRMLFEEPRALEAYILKTKDREMHRWWAQYLESVDEMETALQFYEAAEDYLSLVRLYCYCNNLEKAAEIANETGDRAACFHLGRQFENQDNIKEAVHFFTRARAHNNAIRICKEHGLEDQLMNLALMSGPQEMAEVARYYEQQPSQQEKAIMLYQKAGYLTKAVELAFKAREYSALQMIASDLSQHTDPQLLHQCAQFFMENGQYEKAVDLLAVAKQYVEALDLCVEHNVLITEELAEKLTLEKNFEDRDLRLKILEKIGECCMVQENYHLAAKKFTQAGNKVQAMKALLKSGDTEKIIFFAGVSRQREIYVMAANYLQSLDWRQDPEIMRNIITFYTKGKALDLLAGFYDACAQVEVDEYQNYEKALGALNEAYKCISKAQSTIRVGQLSEKMEQLKLKMELVKQFVQMKHLYENGPDDAVKQCEELLQLENIDIAVRRGDIYGFLVEHFCRQQNYKAAYNLLEQMQTKLPGINLPYYIKIENLKAIYKALDIEPVNHMAYLGEKKQGISDNGDLSENEVEEDYQAVENGY